MDKGKTKYQQQQKSGNKSNSSRGGASDKANPAESAEKARSRELADEIDGRFGFHRMTDVSGEFVILGEFDRNLYIIGFFALFVY